MLPLCMSLIAHHRRKEFSEANGLLFGFPTTYNSMSDQMKAFFDLTGGLWKEQKLAGGQETTARKEAAKKQPLCVNVALVYTGVDFSKRSCGFSVIRSGQSMENALRACCKGIKIGKILLHREGDNGQQVQDI
ncbi:hypothetical protein L2E82_30626 [Cichorium intybus]|uniref:Uncharacterized protein n=1 Tax=Cichorium intybus TaxID=13427 RepID=A0ACB9D1L0_CICIN|nr:hypothetical protein L2E82_30626 [Cichorium intybus]